MNRDRRINTEQLARMSSAHAELVDAFPMLTWEVWRIDGDRDKPLEADVYDIRAAGNVNHLRIGVRLRYESVRGVWDSEVNAQVNTFMGRDTSPSAAVRQAVDDACEAMMRFAAAMQSSLKGPQS